MLQGVSYNLHDDPDFQRTATAVSPIAPTFGIIGHGPAGQRNHRAINMVGGVVEWIYDPFRDNGFTNEPFPVRPSGRQLSSVSYVVIATPTFNHKFMIDLCLDYPVQLIVEKPLVLPWEKLPDSDRVNVMLQYRYADLALTNPSKLVNTFIRDEDWWASWKGTPELSGGLIYMLHIHYIDLALRHNMAYEGHVVRPGIADKQHRTVMGFEPSFVTEELGRDQDKLYKLAYEDILDGGGIKPDDIRYLMHICDALSIKNSPNTSVRMPRGGILK